MPQLVDKLSRFRSKRDRKLPRRLRLKLAKQRRKHQRWVHQLFAVNRAVSCVNRILDGFAESETLITDPEKLLKGVT